mgnify:CR=1 FL=1
MNDLQKLAAKGRIAKLKKLISESLYGKSPEDITRAARKVGIMLGSSAGSHVGWKVGRDRAIRKFRSDNDMTVSTPWTNEQLKDLGARGAGQIHRVIAGVLLGGPEAAIRFGEKSVRGMLSAAKGGMKGGAIGGGLGAGVGGLAGHAIGSAISKKRLAKYIANKRKVNRRLAGGATALAALGIGADQIRRRKKKRRR